MSRKAPRLAALLAALLVAGSVPAVGQDDAANADASVEPLLKLTDVGGQPEPGRYRDDSLAVELEFTLHDGWADGWAAPPFGVGLESEDGAHFSIGDVDGYLLARPCMVEDDDTYPDEHADIELAPETVMGHWQVNPLLNNEGMVPVSVAGTEGYQLDVRVDLSGLGRRCVEADVPLWGEEGIGQFSLSDDTRARIILFEIEGTVIALVLDGVGRAAFEAALELGMPVIESLSVPSMETPTE